MSEWSLERAVSRFLEDKSLGFGDVISHDWMRWALDIPEPRNLAHAQEVQWQTLERVEQFKEALLVDHCIYLQSVRGHGYLIVHPKNQAGTAIRLAMKAVRREIEKCQTVISHTRVSMLSADEHKRHVDAAAKVGGLSAMLNKQRRDVFALFQ